MLDPAAFIEFYSQFIRDRGQFPSHDIAAMCVLATQPARRFEIKHIASAMGVDYHVAYMAMKRLRLQGYAVHGKLTETGFRIMGLDPSLLHAQPIDRMDEVASGRAGHAAPPAAPDAVPDPADLF